MRTHDIIRRAGRGLKQAKARTLLTSLAIAVGAFTLTLSLAAGEGARQYADKLIHSNIDPQSLYIVKDSALTGEGGGLTGGLKEYNQDQTQYGGATFKALSASDINTIRHTEGIVSVQPTYVVQAEYIEFEGKDKKYTADVAVYDSSILPEVAAGKLPARGIQINDKDIVVPESYAETLGTNAHDLIGKKVTLHLQKATPTPTETEIQQAFQSGGFDAVERLSRGETRDATFTVRAVSAKSSTSLSSAGGLYISENQSRELSEFLTQGTSQYQKYISASAKVAEGVDPEVVKNKIDNKNDMKARTAQDLQSLLFTIVNTLQGIVIGFGIIALIASVFGIINTQYISVLERTSEIGLMKALGMRRRHVSRLFQIEAAWIGLLGGVIGAALAVGIGTALNPWITKTLSLGADTSLLIFQPLPILLLLVSLMLIAMLAGYFPSRKAAKLDPIEALRTE